MFKNCINEYDNWYVIGLRLGRCSGYDSLEEQAVLGVRLHLIKVEISTLKARAVLVVYNHNAYVQICPRFTINLEAARDLDLAFPFCTMSLLIHSNSDSIRSTHGKPKSLIV